jgi:RNA polymerase sigma factor (sigma-70 family)
MTSLNSRTTAEAGAYLTDIRPSGVQSRMCLKYAERRFTSVVQPYLADAHALAHWLTGNHADSQDVVQDACLRALHGIASFADGDARSWVLTIVRRTAFDWLRRNRPATIVRAEDMEALERMQVLEPDVGSTETCLINNEDERLLDSAVAGLPPHYRQTLALRHVRGLTYREIAESTGVSIGTVMSRLSRARRHLISRMTNNEIRNKSDETPIPRSACKCIQAGSADRFSSKNALNWGSRNQHSDSGVRQPREFDRPAT